MKGKRICLQGMSPHLVVPIKYQIGEIKSMARLLKTRDIRQGCISTGKHVKYQNGKIFRRQKQLKRQEKDYDGKFEASSATYCLQYCGWETLLLSTKQRALRSLRPTELQTMKEGKSSSLQGEINNSPSGFTGKR